MVDPLLLDAADEHLRACAWPVHDALGKCIGWRATVAKQKGWLHRLMLSPLPGQLVDHTNGNTSDYRRGNLRVCSRAENKRNCVRHKRHAADVPYKGVYSVRGRWRAIIRCSGRNRHLGYFGEAEAAALAYDRAASAEFGAFACLNFPAEGGRSARASR